MNSRSNRNTIDGSVVNQDTKGDRHDETDATPEFYGTGQNNNPTE